MKTTSSTRGTRRLEETIVIYASPIAVRLRLSMTLEEDCHLRRQRRLPDYRSMRT